MHQKHVASGLRRYRLGEITGTVSSVLLRVNVTGYGVTGV